MHSRRFYRDEEAALFAADGLHSRHDVWRNDQHQHPYGVGNGYFAMRPEYVGRFSTANGGIRRFSEQYPQRIYHLPQAQRSLPYYPGYVPYHYPIRIGGEKRRVTVRKKRSSNKTKKRHRPTAQFYPGVPYPNANHQYYAQYQTAFPSSPTSIIQNQQRISSPTSCHIPYQHSSGVGEISEFQDWPKHSYNVTEAPAPVWYEKESDLPSTFASRFTRDNRPYYLLQEKTRGGEYSFDEHGGRYFSTLRDDVDEEIERNVQDISSDLENYRNEIILRPPGTRAGLAFSRQISRENNNVAIPKGHIEVGKEGVEPYKRDNCDNSEKPISPPPWTKQLASILRSKQDRHGQNLKTSPLNIKLNNSKARVYQPQVIHKFLPDATFGIHRQIVETDDHAFNEFECNCNRCSDEICHLPEEGRSNLGHSYYNLLDDGNRHLEHDSNNNYIESETTLRSSNKPSGPTGNFDAQNIPKLRYTNTLKISRIWIKRND